VLLELARRYGDSTPQAWSACSCVCVSGSLPSGGAARHQGSAKTGAASRWGGSQSLTMAACPMRGGAQPQTVEAPAGAEQRGVARPRCVQRQANRAGRGLANLVRVRMTG
jgi:hypothetical protein